MATDRAGRSGCVAALKSQPKRNPPHNGRSSLLLALIICSALVAAALLVSQASAPATATAPLDSEEQLFLSLINQYRQQNGAGPLTINQQLQDAAEWMSGDMSSK